MLLRNVCNRQSPLPPDNHPGWDRLLAAVEAAPNTDALEHEAEGVPEAVIAKARAREERRKLRNAATDASEQLEEIASELRCIAQALAADGPIFDPKRAARLAERIGNAASRAEFAERALNDVLWPTWRTDPDAPYRTMIHGRTPDEIYHDEVPF